MILCMYMYVYMVRMYGMNVESTFHVTFNNKVEIIPLNFHSKWEFIGFLKTAEKRKKIKTLHFGVVPLWTNAITVRRTPNYHKTPVYI